VEGQIQKSLLKDQSQKSVRISIKKDFFTAKLFKTYELRLFITELDVTVTTSDMSM